MKPIISFGKYVFGLSRHLFSAHVKFGNHVQFGTSDVISSLSIESINIKPKMSKVFGETLIIWNPERSLTAGQPMGLLLSLTYPTTTTSRSVRR